MKEINENDISKYGNFAVILKCMLSKRHITQGELAEAIGLSRATITNYVKGKYSPTQQNLKKIAKYLNISPHDFYGDAKDFAPYFNVAETIFSENISALIKQKGISQETLAKELNVSRQSVNYYANGRMMPNKSVLKKICEYFNVEEADLMTVKAKNKSDVRLVVSKMPTEMEECLFIKSDCKECKFGGLCDVKNCSYLVSVSDITNDNIPF